MYVHGIWFRRFYLQMKLLVYQKENTTSITNWSFPIRRKESITYQWTLKKSNLYQTKRLIRSWRLYNHTLVLINNVITILSQYDMKLNMFFGDKKTKSRICLSLHIFVSKLIIKWIIDKENAIIVLTTKVCLQGGVQYGEWWNHKKNAKFLVSH